MNIEEQIKEIVNDLGIENFKKVRFIRNYLEYYANLDLLETYAYVLNVFNSKLPIICDKSQIKECSKTIRLTVNEDDFINEKEYHRYIQFHIADEIKSDLDLKIKKSTYSDFKISDKFIEYYIENNKLKIKYYVSIT